MYNVLKMKVSTQNSGALLPESMASATALGVCLHQVFSAFVQQNELQCVWQEQRFFKAQREGWPTKGVRHSDEQQLNMSLPSCLFRLSTQKRVSNSWMQKNTVAISTLISSIISNQGHA